MFITTKPTVNKWSACSREQVAVWANDIVKIEGRHCKDTSPPKCEDLCPGDRCKMTPDTICDMAPGSCNGNYKAYFDEYCQKSCGLCSDGSTAPVAPTPKPATESCKDKCPGAECMVSVDDLCQKPDKYGGCNGGNSYYFGKYCPQLCGTC